MSATRAETHRKRSHGVERVGVNLRGDEREDEVGDPTGGKTNTVRRTVHDAASPLHRQLEGAERRAGSAGRGTDEEM